MQINKIMSIDSSYNCGVQFPLRIRQYFSTCFSTDKLMSLFIFRVFC